MSAIRLCDFRGQQVVNVLIMAFSKNRVFSFTVSTRPSFNDTCRQAETYALVIQIANNKQTIDTLSIIADVRIYDLLTLSPKPELIVTVRSNPP